MTDVPRRRAGCAALCVAGLLGAIAGGFLGWLGSDLARLGSETGIEPRITDGWVVVADGMDPTLLRVTASRDGRQARTVVPERDGSFRILVPDGGAFDLHVSDWSVWRDLSPRDGSPPDPTPTHAVEGGLRSLGFGARNVRVRVGRVPLAHAAVRVRAADGAPVPGARVYAQSHDDRVERVTDREGVARFEGLPTRPWRAAAVVPDEPLLTGWSEFVPGGAEVPLRIPAGIEIRVRLAEGVRANLVGGCEIPHVRHVYVEVPWQPDADGSMTFRVPPDLPTLAMTASQRDRVDARTTTQRTVAEGAVAVRDGAVLLLEPLPR